MSRTVFERKVINGSIRGAFCLIIAIKDKLKKEVLIEYEKIIDVRNKYILRFG